MACECDRAAIVAASVELFHATMASLYNGLTVQASGFGGWWTGEWTTREVPGEGSAETSTEYYWTGDRYEGTGGTAAFSYSDGAMTVKITYNLENKGDWDTVNG